MSTINSFVSVEGRISQPRLTAAGPLPPPFGGEWTLLVPEGGLRAGLKALLRTFCLREETIWSMCHWASTRPGQSFAAPAESGSPCATTPYENVPMALSTIRMAPDAPAVHQSFANRSSTRAAGLCAIGGAAILACIGMGYLSHQHAKRDTAPTPHPELAKGGGISAPLQAPLHSDTSQAAAQKLAVTASQPRLDGTDSGRHGLRETNHARRHIAHPSATRAAKVRRHAGHAVSSAPSHRLAHSSHTHQSLARPSAAGDYSPFAPARLGRDEYASVTMPTGARASHETLAAPPARRDNVSDTEWMNHISQRRVTEVPDEFSK
jgi:hypothetical protein